MESESKLIVLTTDLSDEALRAFEPTCDLARGLGASITLLHVHPIVAAPAHGAMLGATGSGAHLGEERERALEAVKRQAEKLDPEIDQQVRVLTGQQPARLVVEYAEEHGAGLIALSTHGHSGLRRVLMGSVAEEILRHAHIPVLCFPPPAGVPA